MQSSEPAGYYGGDPYYGVPDDWAELEYQREKQHRLQDNTLTFCVTCGVDVEDENEIQCDACRWGGEV